MHTPCRSSLRPWLLAAVLALAAGAAWPASALGPHELLLLVNARDPDSLALANRYIALRAVPLRNVLFLDLPDAALAPEAELSPAAFTEAVWAPAHEALRARGLEGQVLAWVYSAGFPVRVRTEPRLSIQGLTFFRNQAPEEEDIRLGQAASQLFRGPVAPGGPSGPPLTLETLGASLGARMPLPSMTLAHTGARGLPLDEAVALLRRSAEADATRPDGTFVFVESEDVRARTRRWQFDAAVAELAELGVAAEVADAMPRDADALLGVMAGAATVRPDRMGRFVPGAVADHLTSFGAVFDTGTQTKLTAWLEAGAASSSGTVVEPLSIWTKFPTARLFAHYARGLTLLEAYAQSVASPVQLLAVGDPLTAPWAPDLALTLVEEEAPADADTRVFTATLEPGRPFDLIFFLDGERVGPLRTDPRLALSADRLAGHHRLRAVAYVRGPLRHQAFAEIDLDAPRPGRPVRLALAGPDGAHPIYVPLEGRIEAGGDPRRVALFAQGREMASFDGGGPHAFTLDPAELGAGPVRLHAVAEHADGMAVRSAPARIEIDDAPPPAVRLAIRRRREAGGTVLLPTADGPGAQAWRPTWMVGLWPRGGPDLEPAEPEGEARATFNADSGVLRVARPGEDDETFVHWLGPAGSGDIEVWMAIDPERARRLTAGEAGLVFGAADGGAYGFLGLDARRSGWILGVIRDGRLRRRAARGAPIAPDAWYRLQVRPTGDGGYEARVDGRLIGTLGPSDLPATDEPLRAGVRAHRTAAHFRRPLRSADGWPGLAADRPPALRADRGFDRAFPLWLRAERAGAAQYLEASP